MDSSIWGSAHAGARAAALCAFIFVTLAAACASDGDGDGAEHCADDLFLGAKNPEFDPPAAVNGGVTLVTLPITSGAIGPGCAAAFQITCPGGSVQSATLTGASATEFAGDVPVSCPGATGVVDCRWRYEVRHSGASTSGGEGGYAGASIDGPRCSP
jgi:hypothetical protein